MSVKLFLKSTVLPASCVTYARIQSHNVSADSHESSHEFKFPKSQLFNPSKPYPQWDKNWDFRDEDKESESDSSIIASSSSKDQQKKNNGKTRHIILVRHGQYDESSSDDEKRILTAIGREQAMQTGKRINEMITYQIKEKNKENGLIIKDNNKNIDQYTIRLHSSNMSRAKETSQIISEYLPKTIEVIPPNSLLNEGRPCHVVPEGRSKGPAMSTKSVHKDSARIEAGFREIFHRHKPSSSSSSSSSKNEGTYDIKGYRNPNEFIQTMENNQNNKKSKPEKHEKHEYDIVVCHGNVIRYFALRALQLPPEAWLRLCTFNCSITYLVVRPTGSVSLRTLGDIGHLDMKETTFSGHYGFEW